MLTVISVIDLKGFHELQSGLLPIRTSFLKNISEGTRVMCDSNRVKGTVKQYLVTDDNDIVVNDLGTFYIHSNLPHGP